MNKLCQISLKDDQVITSLLPSLTQSKLLKEKLDVLQATKERMELQRKGFTDTALFSTRIITALWRMQVSLNQHILTELIPPSINYSHLW